MAFALKRSLLPSQGTPRAPTNAICSARSPPQLRRRAHRTACSHLIRPDAGPHLLRSSLRSSEHVAPCARRRSSRGPLTHLDRLAHGVAWAHSQLPSLARGHTQLRRRTSRGDPTEHNNRLRGALRARQRTEGAPTPHLLGWPHAPEQPTACSGPDRGSRTPHRASAVPQARRRVAATQRPNPNPAWRDIHRQLAPEPFRDGNREPRAVANVAFVGCNKPSALHRGGIFRGATSPGWAPSRKRSAGRR